MSLYDNLACLKIKQNIKPQNSQKKNLNYSLSKVQKRSLFKPLCFFIFLRKFKINKTFVIDVVYKRKLNRLLFFDDYFFTKINAKTCTFYHVNAVW